jgi:nucleoside-diphosphate-sugar epimerase
VKRPSLERQRTILGVEPEVSLEDGVRRVCETMRRRLAAAVTAPR